MASSRDDCPPPSLEEITKTPKHIFDQLTLPQIQETSHNGDPRNSTKSGQDSSHRTITGRSGLFRLGCEPTHYPPSTLLNCTVTYCDRALEEGETERFAATEISRMESTFHTDDDPFFIPSQIGLPIWMRYLHDDPNIDSANSAATCLHLIGDLNDEGFGSPSKMWLGSAVVARKDGKTLLPQHLNAMVSFCEYVFQKAIGPEAGSVGLSEDAEVRAWQKTTFQKLASKQGFLDFYKKYSSDMGIRYWWWRGIPSPYDDELLGGERRADQDRTTSKLERKSEPNLKGGGRSTRNSAKTLDVSLGTAEGKPRERARKRSLSYDHQE